MSWATSTGDIDGACFGNKRGENYTLQGTTLTDLGQLCHNKLALNKSTRQIRPAFFVANTQSQRT
eukprot:scaffold587_cov339-Pavlova_lutheri.AAC.23